MAVMTIGTASFAMTAEEAYATKDANTIIQYCVTNKIKKITDFICQTNKADFATFKQIYDTNTNKFQYSYWWKVAAYTVYGDEADELKYNLNLKNTKEVVFVLRQATTYKTRQFWRSSKAKSRFLYATVKEIMSNYIPAYTNAAEVAIKIDTLVGNNDNVMTKALYAKAAGKDYKSMLDIALYWNDVDKIIDALLIADSTIGAKHIEAVIEPLNAVDNEYHKADIVKILTNLNSWCTIRLYDDQKTWEPILAKVRGMISVRK